MEIDSVVRVIIVGLITAGMFLSWLLLLAGTSALQNICGNNCRFVTGLSWFVVWTQLFVFLLSLPVQLGKFSVARNLVIFIFAVTATVEILQADRLLHLKDANYGHASRINATVAGHSGLAAFNLLSILALGLLTFDEDDGDSGKPEENEQHKHYPMPPGSHHMKPMTSRASSMRASSPPASEANYPAVPGRY